MQIKIAHIIGSLKSGGAEILLLDILNSLNDKSSSFFVIYKKKGALYQQFAECGVRLIEFPTYKKFGFKYFYGLRRILKENSIQLLHVHQPFDALIFLFVSFGMKMKRILTLHGYFYKGLKIYFWLLKVRMNKLVFVSHEVLRHYSAHYNKGKPFRNQMVLHNGISLKKFEFLKVNNLRASLGLSDEIFLMASVGNFTPVRDGLPILRFLVKLKKRGISFAFLFIGAKSDTYPEIYNGCVNFCKENELNEYVKFLGSRNDIPDILNQIDAFVYFSRSDTFGIAVIEAIISGLPVFLNDYKTMLEITQNGRHAIIYSSAKENDLFEKFMQYYESREFYSKQLGTNAKWAREKYDIKNHIKKLTEMYKELL